MSREDPSGVARITEVASLYVKTKLAGMRYAKGGAPSLAAMEFGVGKGAGDEGELIALGDMAVLLWLIVGTACATGPHADREARAQKTSPKLLRLSMVYSKATAMLPKLLQKAAN
jgi:hypothetical protein